MAGLGTLVVSLVAESGEFIKGLDKASAGAGKFGKQVSVSTGSIVKGMLASQAAIGIASGAMDVFVSAVGRAGSAIDSAASFGTTPEKFYEMRAAVEGAGDSFEAIPAAMAKFNTVLGDIGSSADGNGRIVKELGLNLNDLKKADPTDALKMVAVALQGIEDPVTRARVGQELLGKSYKDIAPALANYASATTAASGVTGDMLKAIDDADDAVAALKTQLGNVATQIVAGAAPAFQAFLGEMIKTTNEGGNTVSVVDSITSAFESLFMGLVAGKSSIMRVMDFLGASAAATVETLKGNFAGVAAIKKAWEENDTAAAASLSKSLENIGTSRAVAAKAAREARGDFRDTADAAERAVKAAKYEADQKVKAAKALADANRFGKLISKKGDAAKEADADQKKIRGMLDSTAKQAATVLLTPVEAQLKAFSMLRGVTEKQEAAYAKLVKQMAVDTSIKDFNKQIVDLDFQLKNFGKNDVEVALAAQQKAFTEAGMSAEAAAARIDTLRTSLMALSAAKFAKEMENAQDAIDKIGKNEFDSKTMDIKAKYKTDLASPDGAVRDEATRRMNDELAMAQKEFSAKARETMRGINDDLKNEKLDLLGTPAEKALDAFQKLVKQNPAMAQFEAEYMQVVKNKEAWTEYAKHVVDTRQAFKDIGGVALSGLEGMIDGTKSLDDAMGDLRKSIEKMIVQALLIKPLQRDMEKFADSLFTSASGSKGAAGGGGSGGGITDLFAMFKNAMGGGGGGSGGGAAAGGSSGGGVGDILSTAWDYGKSIFGFASGGVTTPGQLVQVAEGNEPELFHTGGKSYLLAGAGSGQVSPALSAPANSAGGATQITNHYTIDARGADAGVEQKIKNAMEQTRIQTLAEVQSRANRGGNFAKAVGRAV